MPKSKNLTKEQKQKLAQLEPALQDCVITGNFSRAKTITGNLQELLRPTGHETRLLQAKNWLYECAIESGNLSFAERGFLGTKQKASPRTRLYIEATALLGVCYLRKGDTEKAKKQIIEAIDKINNIKSDSRRRQFHERLLTRLEEESILAGLVDKTAHKLDVDEIDIQAIKLIKHKTKSQLLIELGSSLPPKSSIILNDIRSTYQNRLPAPERLFLPAPLTEDTKEELGKRANSALKRVAWRSLCDKESELYQAWSNGLSVVYDKKYIASAIVAAFGSFSISGTMIAASVAALAIKFGVKVFCETFAPQSLMIDRKDKS